MPEMPAPTIRTSTWLVSVALRLLLMVVIVGSASFSVCAVWHRTAGAALSGMSDCP